MSQQSVQWKIGGEAGFGIMTTGLIFSRVMARGGLKTFAYPEYPSLIRGGHNTYQVTVDPVQSTSQLHTVHLLVALNRETITLHEAELADNAAVVYDPDDWGTETPTLTHATATLVAVPLTALTKQLDSARVARNTVSLGASFALLNYPWEIVEGVINDWFGRKKPELAAKNLALTKAGYDAVIGKYNFPHHVAPVAGAPKQMVISGNGSIAMGAMKAGMKFYAAYPMTPSSDILGYLARQEDTMGLVVKHTESEIAAMNMAIGAGFAGVRAMTGTSGGGFALMVEALGLAGIAEVPVVVVMGQRPGPSTGLPTWTSQSDLRFVLHASQGEFPRIVLAPGDAQECFYVTYHAFNLAEIYQLPVLILVDKYVQESWQSVEPYDTSKLTIDRGSLLSAEQVLARNEKHFKRHEHTDTGISPRTVPGVPGGVHIASSYEHNEEGFTTEDELETTKQNDKRMRKLDTYLMKHAHGPQFFGPENADITIVGWGSTKLTALAAVRIAEERGISMNYLHFTEIYPLPVAQTVEAFNRTKKTLCVEGNKLGQFEQWVFENTGIRMTGNFHKYGGRPFYPEEIIEQALNLI
ncbi:MAG: 2-oxoacid:acceptor oxidoreductase subunit alpha [Candidatus Kerfeldbacteria bacterium]|nr:2-oxoacid:acceptor oxidoreductase subunit alpha [Candidatus Kerfeldbacteria bacterium]